MRVLHLIDKFSMDGVNPSSCTRLFAQWAPRFERGRFELLFCGLKTAEPAGEWLRALGCRVLYLGKGKLSPSSVSALERLTHSERVDILHLHGYSSANFGRVAAARQRIPAVVHEHAILRVRPDQFLADFVLRRKTTVGVAVSEAVKRFMMRGRSVPEERIVIINNGVDLGDFAGVTAAQARAALAGLGVPEGAPVVGTVTRLREEKGNRYLIEAAAILRRSVPDLRVLIVGDGPQRSALEQLSARLGLSQTVVFTGFRRDIPALLAGLTVNVIPSLTEGFPLAMVEAMAAGNPIVSSAVGGILEVARDGDNALLVPPAEAEALAGAILRVLQSDSLAHSLSEAARRESARYSVENNVRELEQLYDRLQARDVPIA